MLWSSELPVSMKSPAVSAGINDSEDFDNFFRREWLRLVAFCCVAFRLPRAVAEEVAQEAFLQLYRYRNAVDAPGAYLRKIATRMALRLPPEVPHEEIAEAGGALPGDLRPEGRHLVRQALAQLPQQQRAVFALHLDDYSDSQIGGILGLGAATVRSYRRHARRTLHRWYEANGHWTGRGIAVKKNLVSTLRLGYEDLVAEIQTTTDADDALTALHRRISADAGLVQPGSTPLDHWMATRYARRTPEEQISTDRRHPERDEVELICEAISDMMMTLAGDDTRYSNAMRVTSAAMFFVSAAVRYLAELQGQIANRTATRETANRLVRLVEHNLAEAVQLFSAQHRSARKHRDRALLDGLLGDAGEIARAIRALYPRIMRLFQDSDQSAPRVPVPHGPA